MAKAERRAAEVSGGCRVSGRRERGVACARVYTHAHTANLWAGPSNVVLDSASLSISNAVVLAKSPFSFSNACCTGAVGIALMSPRCL